MKRNVCVITGSRAEYGILRPLIEEIRNDAALKLRLVVTGMHLSSEFGVTYHEIEEDGFKIDEKVEIFLASDTPIGIARSVGLGIMGFAKVYERLKPDIVVVVGDRFEIFSAVSAALIAGKPVAHLYGGELTKGAFDDSLRHSITKMSHLHFTSTEEYRKRVIQLGEAPSRVFNVGALALDSINKLLLLSKNELEKKLDFKFGRHNLLVTFHPVTLERGKSKEYFKNLLDILRELKDTKVIFTKANADPEGRIINSLIDDYAAENKGKVAAFTSMGQMKYLSAMRAADAVVGNSSSGIIEAPSFKIGTINIGDRQAGRIKTKGIIDCKPTKKAIRAAIKKLYSKKFQKVLKRVVTPYGDGKAAKRIKNILKNYDINNILKKKFYDINFDYRS